LQDGAGVVRVVLAILAGLVAAVTIWSTIFMAGIAWLVRFIKGSDTGGGPKD
jgi:hypothetical protein